jgi:hypothetical protein
MTPLLPMFCLLLTGNPSPAVRQVAANVSKLVSKLPDGSIKDALEVALAEKEWRPILKRIREAKETAKLIDRELKEMERRTKKSLRNSDFPNIEDYGPKPKRRSDG